MGKSSNKSAAPAVVAPEVVVPPANAGLVPKQGATKAKNKPPPNKAESEEPKTRTSYQRPPASGGKTLYVGNIFGADRDQLNQFFRNVAKVSHIGLPAHEDSQPKDSTYVTFASVGEAEKALQLNGKDFLGRAVIIERPSQGGASAQGTRHGGSFGKSSGGPGLEVIVKGFDQSKRENDVRSALQEHFSGCGVTRMRVLMDYTTDTNKGIAFMDCPDKSSFNKTLELDGTYLDGKILRVAEANSKEQPGGASGGGRRGSGDWSGGRFGRGSDDWSGGRFGRRSGDWSGDRFGRRSGDWSCGRFGRGYGDLSGGRFSPYDSRGS